MEVAQLMHFLLPPISCHVLIQKKRLLKKLCMQASIILNIHSVNKTFCGPVVSLWDIRSSKGLYWQTNNIIKRDIGEARKIKNNVMQIMNVSLLRTNPVKLFNRLLMCESRRGKRCRRDSSHFYTIFKMVCRTII